MERWKLIGWGIAASALAHVLFAVVIFLSTEVRTYDQAAPDPIPVDVVSEEPEKAPEPVPTPSPTPTPSLDLSLPKPTASSSQPAGSQQQVAAQPAAPAQPSPQPSSQPSPQPSPREIAKPQAQPAPRSKPQPQPQQQPQPQLQAQQPQPQQQTPPQQQAQPQPQTQAPSASPPPQSAQGYIPAQPDLTVQYGVMLGLPDALPPLASSVDKADNKEVGATATTNLSTDMVGVFRDHLRSCSRLPASISPGDNVMVRLRVLMTPDGRLAADPDTIEVKSPIKGVDLKQSAVSALLACQPYAMLPPERYQEWRVLELSFTPKDFIN